jgi:hypothetical protein
MKTIVTSLVALAVAAGVAGHAEAATYKKKRLHSGHHPHYYRSYGYRHPDDSIGGYYEHRLDAVRFGSQRWWKIYDEQRGRR